MLNDLSDISSLSLKKLLSIIKGKMFMDMFALIMEIES